MTICSPQQIWAPSRAVREKQMDRARVIVRARAAQIRNDAFREHYLTRTWPNAEILVQWHDG